MFEIFKFVFPKFKKNGDRNPQNNEIFKNCKKPFLEYLYISKSREYDLSQKKCSENFNKIKISKKKLIQFWHKKPPNEERKTWLRGWEGARIWDLISKIFKFIVSNLRKIEIGTHKIMKLKKRKNNKKISFWRTSKSREENLGTNREK